MTTIELPQCEPGSPEWHAQRALAIGGSEAAACCGLDPYESPLSLFLAKTGVIPPVDDNEAMAWGRRMEEPIAIEWAERRGLYLARPTATLARADLPWMHANPDRFVYESPAWQTYGAEPMGLAEFKLSHDVERWRDGPPDAHVLQVQHYLAVTGLDLGWLIGLVSDRRFRLETFEIERDDVLIERLIEAEAEMMRRIDEGDPPAASANDADVLAAAFVDSEPGARVELPGLARVVLDDLETARLRHQAAADDRARLENQLRAWIGNAEIGTLDGDVAVTWKAHDVSRLDTKALRDADPDVFAAYSHTTRQRRLLTPQRR